MTITEGIRHRLRAGQDPETIAMELGVTINRVRVIRWEMRHPEYRRTYMQRWRECNPGAEKRRAVEKLIRASQERRGKYAERVQQAIG